MSKLKKPTLMMVISMAIFGTIAPFVRMTGLASGEVALYRAVMAALVIGLFLILTRRSIPLKEIKGQIPLLMLSGVAMGFNWILLFQAYKYTTASVATLSYYFAPVIVTLVCPILFKERMTAKNWVCFVMSTLGLALITGIGDMGGSNKHLIGILFGLGAAVLYATVILLNKYTVGVDGIHRTFLQFIAAIVVLVPYVALTGGFHLGDMDGIGITALVTVGVIHTGITYCMYFSSMKELAGQKVAVLGYIDPLVAVLISSVIEVPMGPMQWLGGALILGFTLINELNLPLKRK